jgi:trimeric autotransporter adhesin
MVTSMLSGRKLPITLAFLAVIVFTFGVSCRGFFTNPVLTTIAVGPTGQNVQLGTTLQMSARGTYDDGSSKNITASVLWSSDNDSFATVGTGGLVTGIAAPGTANISASLDALTNSASVNVVLTGVTAITVSPKQANVAQGGSQNFTCTATVTGQQTPVDITSAVTWSTSDTTNTSITNGANPAVFSVNNGTANESVTVTASYTVGTTTFTDTAAVTVIQ